MLTHFFLLAFSAALVVLPETSLGVVAYKKTVKTCTQTKIRKEIYYLDDTDGNSLPHVPDGKPSKGRELSEGLDAHGLAGEQLDNGSVTGLDELGSILSGLSSTPVNLLQDLGELAGNVRGVAIKHRRVAIGHLRKRMIKSLPTWLQKLLGRNYCKCLSDTEWSGIGEPAHTVIRTIYLPVIIGDIHHKGVSEVPL